MTNSRPHRRQSAYTHDGSLRRLSRMDYFCWHPEPGHAKSSSSNELKIREGPSRGVNTNHSSDS
jgi:hypothetical protein